MTHVSRISKLQKLRDLRTRLRFAQLVSSKLSETKREKERKEAFAVHDRSKRTAIAIIQGAMDEAKSINDPGARYAAIVKRMGRAHDSVEKARDEIFAANYRLEDASLEVAEAQKAYASVYRDHLKLDALAVRMHSKDLTRKELMEEETTSDILIAFAEGEDI